MLFVAAKLAHLHHLPQGQPERAKRTRAMVDAMDAAGFGNCTNHYECEAACPKNISADYIAMMNRDYAKSMFAARDEKKSSDGAG
jgi:succinate dehydrogenase / fumarate reductase iron-sulfur subunit